MAWKSEIINSQDWRPGPQLPADEVVATVPPEPPTMLGGLESSSGGRIGASRKQISCSRLKQQDIEDSERKSRPLTEHKKG